jgi:hypothetical protein
MSLMWNELAWMADQVRYDELTPVRHQKDQTLGRPVFQLRVPLSLPRGLIKVQNATAARRFAP